LLTVENVKALNTPASVKTRPEPVDTRKTAAILIPKAMTALERSIRGPTRARAKNGAKPSVKGEW
jgi:hypothetical protein